MWIKKINEFFDKLSEYDNNSLLLHVAVDVIDMLKERVTFNLDNDGMISIQLLKYGDMEEDIEIDEDGFLYWLQFTFHKELIDIVISLKQKHITIQNLNKKLISESKLLNDNATKQNEINSTIEKNVKEMEALSMIVNKVDTYRRNTFAYLRDKESVDKLINHIKIYKDQSD